MTNTQIRAKIKEIKANAPTKMVEDYRGYITIKSAFGTKSGNAVMFKCLTEDNQIFFTAKSFNEDFIDQLESFMDAYENKEVLYILAVETEHKGLFNTKEVEKTVTKDELI